MKPVVERKTLHVVNDMQERQGCTCLSHHMLYFAHRWFYDCVLPLESTVDQCR